MATTAETSRRIDLELHVIRADVDDLSEVERTWDEESDPNQHALRMEWWDTAGRLQSLRELHDAGQMTGVQQQQYRALLERVREMVPIMERLRFDIPPVLSETEPSSNGSRVRG